MSNLKPIIFPLLPFNFTPTPYSGQVQLGGATGPSVWNMGGVGAVITRFGGTFDWTLTLFDDTTQQSGQVTAYFGANHGGNVFFWNNIMVFPNANISKGMQWDYATALQFPGTTTWFGRGQQGLSLGIFPNDNGLVCFPQGGLPCVTTMGSPLNYYDRVHGWTFWDSAAGCPSGANFGASCIVPLSKFASFTSNKGFYNNGVNPYITTAEQVYFFDQQKSAPAGDGILFTIDSNETNNIIRCYALSMDTNNVFDCNFNRVEYNFNPLWSFDLRDTIYSNNTAQATRIVTTNRKGTVLVMTAHDAHTYFLVIQLPGPYIQPIELASGIGGGSINPLRPMLLDNGKIVIMNGTGGTPSFWRSTQSTVLGFDLRLPSYADPMFVNGTDTITIL